MEESEYNERLKKLEEGFKKAKEDLMIEYALSKAKYNVGNIISNGPFTIQVAQIGAYIGFTAKYPSPTYRGPELTKALTPKKSGDTGCIYGNEGTTLLKKAND